MDSKTPTFSVENLKLLIQQEREMDAGRVPFVYVEGSTQRLSMRPEMMAELGLEVGQKISGLIFTEILNLNLQQVSSEIAYRDLLKEKGLLAEGPPEPGP